MNWSRRNSDDAAALRRVVVFTVMVILIGAIDVGLGGQLRALARDALTPFGNSLTSAWRSFMDYSSLSSRAELLEQVRALEGEVSRLRERDALTRAVLTENEELRMLARMATSSSVITAPVASSFRASPYGTFVIAAGWRDGVETGALVYSPEGFLLGTVADIGMRTATVRFVFAPEARVEAVSGDIAFTLVGQGLSSAVAEVPVETPIAVWDPVVAPAFGNAPIGVVTHIASTSASVYSDIFVTLPTSMHAIRHVLVVPFGDAAAQ